MEKNHLGFGYFLAFLTIVIWSGWMIISRMGLTSSLTPMDVTYIRFTVAGLIMLPIAIKNRHLIKKDNYKAIILMIIGAGAPYLMMCNFGFMNAPASHGVLTPSTMPLWVAIMSFFLFSERVGLVRIFGYALIAAGAIYKLTSGHSGIDSADLFFLSGGFLYALYTICSKKHRYLSAIVATSFVTSGSMFLVAIPYWIYQYNNPHELPLIDTLQQVIYQGIFTGIISMITFNRAMQIIGASQTSSFAALVPVMVTLLAIPFLGEMPTISDWIFVVLMSTGVFLASGVIRLRKKQKKMSLS